MRLKMKGKETSEPWGDLPPLSFIAVKLCEDLGFKLDLSAPSHMRAFLAFRKAIKKREEKKYAQR